MRDINIICNESENENFLFFAEFFKLCGIYVIKSVGKPYSERKESGGYIPESTLDMRTEHRWLDSRGNEKLLFQRALEAVCGQDDSMYSELSALSAVYIRNNLLYHSMMERYFYAPFPKRVEECLRGFWEACQDVEAWGLQEGRIHIQYFLLACKHKINMLLGKLRKKKEFDSRSLIREAAGLCDWEAEKKFYQGYVLAGIIADGDLRYLSQSITYYRKAYECTEEKEPVRAYIEYRIGRYYEKVICDEEAAWEAYDRAYGLAPYNYRILYKKAFMELDQGYIWQDRRYIELAREDFHGLYLLIYQDLKNNNLEPIQLEYLTKTYKNLYEIYDIWLDNKENAGQILYSLGGLDRVIHEDVFFDNFFPEEKKARAERELLIRHLNIEAYHSTDPVITGGDKYKRGNKVNAG